MVDVSFLTRLWLWFQQIYDLGDSIIIINLGNGGVSLNDFLLVLAVMTIVLTSLLNFVKVHGDSSVNYAVSSVKGVNKRLDQKSHNFLSSMFD